jgi:hypothetical protein
MSRFSVRILFVLPVFLLLNSPALRAQITGATNGTTTPSQGIGHDYIHMLGETVNPVLAKTQATSIPSPTILIPPVPRPLRMIN